MVAETDIRGCDYFVNSIFGNENSRMGKIYDPVSGYLMIRCSGMVMMANWK